MISSVNLQINNVEDLSEFRKRMIVFSGNARLIKGNYNCDAKSLMGILAIDLTSPTRMEFDNFYQKEVNELFAEFIVN